MSAFGHLALSYLRKRCALCPYFKHHQCHIPNFDKKQEDTEIMINNQPLWCTIIGQWAPMVRTILVLFSNAVRVICCYRLTALCRRVVVLSFIRLIPEQALEFSDDNGLMEIVPDPNLIRLRRNSPRYMNENSNHGNQHNLYSTNARSV